MADIPESRSPEQHQPNSTEPQMETQDQSIPLYPVPPAEAPEHPEGDAIRRQVEYYFSDQNLPNDKHLLELCGGSQNLPVSIGEILGWKKMRRFKPKTQVIAALRRSAFLEVIDNKRIRRHVPIVLDDEPNDEELAIDFVSKEKATEQPSAPIPSGQVHYKVDPATPWITKGLLKPTGFEESFAEPAITAEEAKEEEDMYSPDEPFADRIEIAIQRYRARRKFHQAYASHFTAWMKYGGIETGPRQFTGQLDESVFEGRTAGEKARILAEFFAGEDKDDEEQWAVDFEGVAKAYLSQLFEPDEKEVDLATRIMMNFYNYLLHHNVCQEYESQINAARDVCIQALKELPRVNEFVTTMPGDFNNSCSFIFGGYYAQMHPSNNTWSWQSLDSDRKMRIEAARVIFTTAVAVLGSDAMFNTFGTGKLEPLMDQQAYPAGRPATQQRTAIWCSSEVVVSLEVTGIQPPSKETRNIYASSQKDLIGSKVRLEPLGKLICTSWTHPSFEASDLPAGVSVTDGQVLCSSYEFWLEESLLKQWGIGMKMSATLRRLEWMDGDKRDGLWYIDSFGTAYPSFYTCLLNELMDTGKPWKQVVWNKDKEAAEEAERRALEQERERAKEADDEENWVARD